jgi:hypothetical protein
VVDYPYGQNYWKSGQKSRAAAHERRTQASISHYDDSPEYAFDLMADTIPELLRTTRETGWIACFGNYDSEKLMRELFSNCCVVHYDYRLEDIDKACQSAPEGERCKFAKPAPQPWIWYRPNSQNQPRYPEYHAKNFAEYVLVVNRGNARLNRPPNTIAVPNVLVFDADYSEERFHANQKPIPMYQYLIERLTDMGDVVVDPCFGSGASIAAAFSRHRFAYGCELNGDVLRPAIGLVTRYAESMAGLSETDAERRATMLAQNTVAEVQLIDASEVDPTKKLTVRAAAGELDDKYYYVDRLAEGYANARTELEVKQTFTGDNALADAEEWCNEKNSN